MKLPKGVVLGDALKKARSRRGRTSKAKGAAFEKLVAAAIGAWIGLPPSDVFRTRTGSGKEDVGLSEEAAKRFPFHIECKNHKTLHIPEWIRQAQEGSEKHSGLTPIIVFKQHGDASNLHVVIDFQSFMEIVGKLYEGNQNE